MKNAFSNVSMTWRIGAGYINETYYPKFHSWQSSNTEGMSERESITETTARQFLLGGLEESEQERIEALLVTDSSAKDAILLAEQGLIEEFLDGELNDGEREIFVREYQSTAPGRQKIKLTESLRARAISQVAPPQTEAVEAHAFSTGQWWPRLRPVLVPAVFVIVAIVFGSVWLIRWNNRRIEQRDRQTLMAREFAELNSPENLRTTPPQMIAVVLSPGTLRSPEAVRPITPGNYVLELHLLWTRTEPCENCQAVFKRVGTSEKVIIPTVQIERNAGAKVVRVRVPAQFLSRGLYQMAIGEADAGDTAGSSEEYTFTVH